MQEKILSVFIDESGDFGPYDFRSPFYIVTMLLHNQQKSLRNEIEGLEMRLRHLGYRKHAVHTSPLIRREADYSVDSREHRKLLFKLLFNFVRKIDCRYVCAKVRKSECRDADELAHKLLNEIERVLKAHSEFWEQFDRTIVYYDNGQHQLTRILKSVFGNIYENVEFRKVKPVDYKLFQAADLICTMELLREKANAGAFSRSEREFFGSIRDFKKNYLRPLTKKRL